MAPSLPISDACQSQASLGLTTTCGMAKGCQAHPLLAGVGLPSKNFTRYCPFVPSLGPTRVVAADRPWPFFWVLVVSGISG